MIVVMKPTATKEEVQCVTSLVSEMGLQDHVIEGTELTVVAVIGEDRKKDPGVFEPLAGVHKVMRVLEPYKLASRNAQPESTVVTIGEGESACTIGGEKLCVIAGPCSVENAEHIMLCAKACKASGVHALRGGAFKPRTNPYAFQGMGEAGLKALAEARAETGLPIVTEVVSENDVELVAEYADCLQIGTRNAQNFKLLQACGERTNKPILYKRGMSMTLDEYLQAVEYILTGGNSNVILCERGIRTFEKFSRNTLSLSAVVELKHRTHLPVVADPSHGTGHAHLVPSMSKASVAAGADGLAIEVHPDPQHALTDGAQSVTPEVMSQLMVDIARVAEAVDRTA